MSEPIKAAKMPQSNTNVSTLEKSEGNKKMTRVAMVVSIVAIGIITCVATSLLVPHVISVMGMMGILGGSSVLGVFLKYFYENCVKIRKHRSDESDKGTELREKATPFLGDRSVFPSSSCDLTDSFNSIGVRSLDSLSKSFWGN